MTDEQARAALRRPKGEAMPSIIRHPSLVLVAVRHWRHARLGWREAYGDGQTFDDDPWSSRSMAYDVGRDLRRWGRA